MCTSPCHEPGKLVLRFLLQSSLAQIDARYGGRGHFPYGSQQDELDYWPTLPATNCTDVRRIERSQKKNWETQNSIARRRKKKSKRSPNEEKKNKSTTGPFGYLSTRSGLAPVISHALLASFEYHLYDYGSAGTTILLLPGGGFDLTSTETMTEKPLLDGS